MTKNGILTRKRQFSEGERGFSLPEIIIVLVIVSIFVAIALPKSIETLRAYRLDTSVSIISDKLMEARINAIKRNRTSWLTIDKTAKTVQIHSTDSAGTTINVGYPKNLPQGVNLDGTATSIDVSFDSLGRSTSGTQSVTIVESNSTLRKDITVSPAGKVAVSAMYLLI